MDDQKCRDHYRKWYHDTNQAKRSWSDEAPPVKFLKQFQNEYSFSEMNQVLEHVKVGEWKEDTENFIGQLKQDLINLWIEK